MQKSHKLALVTGASRGIGKAIAKRLAGEGYNLVITCSKDSDNLIETAREIENDYSVKCLAKVVDAGSYEQVDALFSDSIFEENTLDLLVNNAGISYVGLLHEMTPEEWHRIMSVNLDSVFYTCRKAVPMMLSNHAGKIINISSVWGNVGASMEVAYSTTKGAINTFSKALAKELAPSGISVNAIACGLIDTAMNACFTEEDLAAVIEEIPADRIGKPEEVADLVARIAGAPDYLTGQVITIDGGWV